MKTEVYDLIAPLCQADKIFLIDVSIQGGGRNTIIKVVVDTESGITLNQCQMLSKNISDLFYRKDLFQGDYRLEVTSPGVNKPLEEPYEFKRNIGKQLKVSYGKGEERKEAIGELISYTPQAISLRIEKEEIIIPLKDIENAKIKLKW